MTSAHPNKSKLNFINKNYSLPNGVRGQSSKFSMYSGRQSLQRRKNRRHVFISFLLAISLCRKFCRFFFSIIVPGWSITRLISDINTSFKKGKQTKHCSMPLPNPTIWFLNKEKLSVLHVRRALENNFSNLKKTTVNLPFFVLIQRRSLHSSCRALSHRRMVPIRWDNPVKWLQRRYC